MLVDAVPPLPSSSGARNRQGERRRSKVINGKDSFKRERSGWIFSFEMVLETAFALDRVGEMLGSLILQDTIRRDMGGDV